MLFRFTKYFVFSPTKHNNIFIIHKTIKTRLTNNLVFYIIFFLFTLQSGTPKYRQQFLLFSLFIGVSLLAALQKGKTIMQICELANNFLPCKCSCFMYCIA